jgi:precorrin-2 dehydrogenase/sirohydrochlorin ferrochelatase
MPDLPVMLKIQGRLCVVVGAGAVALRRARSLVEAGARVTVIAPDIDPAFSQLPKDQVTLVTRPVVDSDLDGAFLVVIATDNPDVNAKVSAAAKSRNLLVNRTDSADLGDITIPAHASHGPVTIAVHTSGISAAASAGIRKQLSDSLDPDWPRLLQLVGPYREKIQSLNLPDKTRQERLKQLGETQTLALLKNQGPEAVTALCEELCRP